VINASGGLRGATIAFDLDGTLVDTAPDLIGALNIILGERSLPLMPVAAARQLVGQGARNLIVRGFARAGAPVDEAETLGLTEQFLAIYADRIAAESRPFPGLEDALDGLAAQGATLCVCTNKSTQLSLALLDALDLTRRFKAVIGWDKAPTRKPHPSHYVAAIDACGGDIARSLMVGDSFADVESAHAAGAPAVVVAFGYSETPFAALGGDAVIDAFSELPAVAARLLGPAG
jgi:phosphoglycolate phosphatase